MTYGEALARASGRKDCQTWRKGRKPLWPRPYRHTLSLAQLPCSRGKSLTQALGLRLPSVFTQISTGVPSTVSARISIGTAEFSSLPQEPQAFKRGLDVCLFHE
jgi:hypothetical protein